MTTMAGLIWVSDREPGIRQLFVELIPEAEPLAPADLESRLTLGHRPDALVIDGTQLLDLPRRLRDDVLHLPRLLICTGMSLAALSPALLTGPDIAVLAKPFAVADLEAALEWLRGVPSPVPPELLQPVQAGRRRR